MAQIQPTEKRQQRIAPELTESSLYFSPQNNCHSGLHTVPVLIAKAKAAAVIRKLEQQWAGQEEGESVVITSDQVVLFHNQIRGKPKDPTEARAFLSSYSAGETLQTVTAVVATHLPSGRQSAVSDTCTVHWGGVSGAALELLLGKEDIYYSCGGLLVEDEDFRACISRVEGDLDSIRGLPVEATKKAVAAVITAAEE